MFEAHYTKADDFQGLETATYSWTKTYYRRHKHSFQPLRIWFAWGKRHAQGSGVQRKLFAYIEYQNAQDRGLQCCLELGPSLSVVEALNLATVAELKAQ